MKESLVSTESRRDSLQLVIIPLLIEHVLDLRVGPTLEHYFVHVGACLADEDTKCDASHTADIMMAVNAELIVGITQQQILQVLFHLRWLREYTRFGDGWVLAKVICKFLILAACVLLLLLVTWLFFFLLIDFSMLFIHMIVLIVINVMVIKVLLIIVLKLSQLVMQWVQSLFFLLCVLAVLWLNDNLFFNVNRLGKDSTFEWWLLILLSGVFHLILYYNLL